MKKISFDSCEVCFSEWGISRVGFGGSGTRLVELCGECLELMSKKEFAAVDSRWLKARKVEER
ncbi:hypothetical protein ABFV99_13285 [Cytobacillus horneckiae]|uniref:hypothetical protein n=1 Tax=Cytobacillus horneckiae TaxID=549687 RepID=UPI0034CDBFE5